MARTRGIVPIWLKGPGLVVSMQFMGVIERMAPNNNFFACSDWSAFGTGRIGQPYRWHHRHRTVSHACIPNEFPMNDVWDYLLICSSAGILCTLLTKKCVLWMKSVRRLHSLARRDMLPTVTITFAPLLPTICPLCSATLTPMDGAISQSKPNSKVRHFWRCAPCMKANFSQTPDLFSVT